MRPFLLRQSCSSDAAKDFLVEREPLAPLLRHFISLFIGPESDHWLCLSLTDSLTHSCLVNLIDVTMACEDANSKLVEVVTAADEDHVGNNLLQILKLRFGQKAKLLFRL